MIDHRRGAGTWIKQWSSICLVVGCGALLACGGDPTEAVESREFVVSLTSPNPSDGAILFSISGGVIAEFRTLATSGPQVHFRSTGPTTTRVAVFGNIATGGLVSFEVSLGERVQDYSAEILQVADRDNVLRSISGYTIEVIEP